MHPLEGLAQQTRWIGKNTSYNLKFIPEDKLAWKPAPTANSALEVVNHIAYVIAAQLSAQRNGGQWQEPEFKPATDLAEAQALIEGLSEEYAANLLTVTPEQMKQTVKLPWGEFPMERAVAMPVVDLTHHHGQIAYIQTLLGDTDFHFFERGT